MLSSFILMSPEDTVVAVCPRMKVAQLVVAQNQKEAAGKREAESSGEKKYRVHGQPGGAGPAADAESGR